MRADRSALGVLPTEAFQFCEAVTSASAFGWYLFPPLEFHVQWDGTDFLWTHGDADDWFPLVSEHFPGLRDVFDEKAPEDVRGFAPPFVTRMGPPGVLQVWTGFFARTTPGWSVLVRPPANLPRSHDYEPYEGIVETDRWFSPIFANLRVSSSNRPILFEPTRPLVQVQPLRRDIYEERHLRSFGVAEGLDDFSDSDWADYRKTIVTRSKDHGLRPGRYATDVRKRARTRDSSTGGVGGDE
jgi:hypothetical protein